MILYKCPKCGALLKTEVLTSIPPIYRGGCPCCDFEKEEREKIIIEVVKE